MGLWARTLRFLCILALLCTNGGDDENRRPDDDEQADQTENEHIEKNAGDEGGDTNGQDDPVALCGAFLKAM